MGASFDCASKSEIEAVLNVEQTIKQELGKEQMITEHGRIGFFHPCKLRSHLQFARDTGINKMTFDSLNELEKVADEYCDSKCFSQAYTMRVSRKCQNFLFYCNQIL